MSYHSLTALGEDNAIQNAIQKCSDQAKSADLDTKAGREEATKNAAECGADAACAYYQVPPGVCGPIGKAIAGEAIKVWNSIFGDDSAQRAALKQRKETSAFFASQNRLLDLETQMAADLASSTKKLIDFYNQMIPRRKGTYGTGPEYSSTFNTWSKDWGADKITVTGYANDLAMRKWLAASGLLHETKWLTAKDKADGRVYPPNLMARMLEGPAEDYAKARRAQLAAVCTNKSGVEQMYCAMNLPSLTVLKTEYATSLGSLAQQFYDSLAKAEKLVSAGIVAMAAQDRALQQTQVKAAISKRSAALQLSQAGMQKAAALILLAGGVAAAVVVYRKRK